MIAVIFELQPQADAVGRYFELVAALKDELQGIDGFLSVERFESVTRPGHFVSLSFWRDEEAVRQWRCHGGHRASQQEGRSRVLAGYRLRVAHVLRDYGLNERDEAPDDARSSLI